MKNRKENIIIAIENRIALGEFNDFPAVKKQLNRIKERLQFGEKMTNHNKEVLLLNGFIIF